MMFKRNKFIDKIEQGDTFFRDMQINAQEQARVLYVSDDVQGIPHVHFERTLVAGGYKDLQGVRVLSLDTFARDFHVQA